MKIIHLSDLHIGKSFEMKSLLEDQEYMLKKVLELIESEKADVLIIAGDIYDRSIPREDAVRVYNDFISEALKINNINILVVSGNHDSAVRLGQMSELLSKMRYHVVSKLSNPINKVILSDEFGPVNFYMLPYADSFNIRHFFKLEGESEKEIYDSILGEIEDQDRKVLISHNFFSSGKIEEIEISDSERRLNIGGEDIIITSQLEKFDYVALGHLHKAQKVGKEHVRYAGSLLKYSVSEINNKKSIPVITLGENGLEKIDYKEIIPMRDFKHISDRYENISKSSYLEKKDDFLNISLLDENRIEDAYTKLSMIYPNIIKLDYPQIIENELKSELQAENINSDPFSLLKDFYKEKYGRDLKSEEEDILSEIMKKMEDKQ